MSTTCSLNFKIGKEGREFTLPASNTNANTKEDLFVQSVLELKENNPLLFEKLKDFIKNYDKIYKGKKLTKLDGSNISNALIGKLESFGIPVNVLPNFKMQELFGEKVQAGVLEGEIYVAENADTSAPIHEFLHIVLAVVKMKSPEEYQNFLYKAFLTPALQLKVNEISAHPSYENMTLNDIMEESLLRVVEDMINYPDLNISDNPDYSLSNNVNLLDALDEFIKPTIQEVFGIELTQNIVLFLSEPINSLKEYNSQLIGKSPNISNGYIYYKDTVKKRGQVLNYIKELIKQGIIEKTEC